MNELVSFGGRPVMLGRFERASTLGLGDGGDVGDLLAYRRQWEPFIAAHLEQWRHVNELFETAPASQRCPSGIFDLAKIANLDPVSGPFCASLLKTRIITSDTNPAGILPLWNVWKNKSSSEILAGAKSMLEWHQSVVLTVGNNYKDELLKTAAIWKLTIQLPPLPTFSLQQSIAARIEAAFIETKGTLQIIGYAADKTLQMAGDVGEAVAEGLKDTAQSLPKAMSTAGIVLAVAAAVVGGGLIIYYIPRSPRRASTAA